MLKDTNLEDAQTSKPMFVLQSFLTNSEEPYDIEPNLTVLNHFLHKSQAPQEIEQLRGQAHS